MTTWDHMAELLADLPDLPGARCVNHVELFDRSIARHRDAAGNLAPEAELDGARSAALRICESGPALARCEAWLASVRPYRRPRGVVAGQVVKLP